jgi:hypothetical protein
MTLIIIALILCAIYSGGTYLYVYSLALRGSWTHARSLS